MSCLLLLQRMDIAVCWFCTGNTLLSSSPLWGGTFWEKGHELCWEQSGVVDQSDQSIRFCPPEMQYSPRVRRCLGSHGDLAKECGEILLPKDSAHQMRLCSRFSPHSSIVPLFYKPRYITWSVFLPQLKVIYREISQTLQVSCYCDNYGKTLAFIFWWNI